MGILNFFKKKTNIGAKNKVNSTNNGFSSQFSDNLDGHNFINRNKTTQPNLDVSNDGVNQNSINPILFSDEEYLNDLNIDTSFYDSLLNEETALKNKETNTFKNIVNDSLNENINVEDDSGETHSDNFKIENDKSETNSNDVEIKNDELETHSDNVEIENDELETNGDDFEIENDEPENSTNDLMIKKDDSNIHSTDLDIENDNSKNQNNYLDLGHFELENDEPKINSDDLDIENINKDKNHYLNLDDFKIENDDLVIGDDNLVVKKDAPKIHLDDFEMENDDFEIDNIDPKSHNKYLNLDDLDLDIDIELENDEIQAKNHDSKTDNNDLVLDGLSLKLVVDNDDADIKSDEIVDDEIENGDFKIQNDALKISDDNFQNEDDDTDSIYDFPIKIKNDDFDISMKENNDLLSYLDDPFLVDNFLDKDSFSFQKFLDEKKKEKSIEDQTPDLDDEKQRLQFIREIEADIIENDFKNVNLISDDIPSDSEEKKDAVYTGSFDDLNYLEGDALYKDKLPSSKKPTLEEKEIMLDDIFIPKTQTVEAPKTNNFHDFFSDNLKQTLNHRDNFNEDPLYLKYSIKNNVSLDKAMDFTKDIDFLDEGNDDKIKNFYESSKQKSVRNTFQISDEDIMTSVREKKLINEIKNKYKQEIIMDVKRRADEEKNNNIKRPNFNDELLDLIRKGFPN